MDKSKPKTIIISTWNYFEKEKLIILILERKISTLAIKKINIAIIGVDAYCTACKLKKAHVFTVSMKNLEY